MLFLLRQNHPIGVLRWTGFDIDRIVCSCGVITACSVAKLVCASLEGKSIVDRADRSAMNFEQSRLATGGSVSVQLLSASGAPLRVAISYEDTAGLEVLFTIDFDEFLYTH